MVIKVSRVKSLEEIKYCNTLMPEYISFVFYEDRSMINLEQAKLLASGINHKIKIVGAFKNQLLSSIVEIANSNVIDAIELDGEEDDKFIKKLKKLTGLKVMKYCDDHIESDYTIRPLIKNNKLELENVFISDYNIKKLTDVMMLSPYGIDLDYSIKDNNEINLLKLTNIISLIRRCN